MLGRFSFSLSVLLSVCQKGLKLESESVYFTFAKKQILHALLISPVTVKQ